MATLETSPEANYDGQGTDGRTEKATYRGTSYRSAQKLWNRVLIPPPSMENSIPPPFFNPLISQHNCYKILSFRWNKILEKMISVWRIASLSEFPPLTIVLYLVMYVSG